MKKTKEFKQFVDELEDKLARDHGHLLSGSTLYSLLGFPSVNAFQQAVHRETINVPLFNIDKRRGKFALTKDVAIWLTTLRFAAIKTKDTKKVSKEVPTKKN